MPEMVRCGIEMNRNNGFNIVDGVLIDYLGNDTEVVIPNSVTEISPLAFSNCVLMTSVVIPDGVTSIGNNAFYNCKALKRIVIPDSVTSIGTGAFSCCSQLESIRLPDGVTELKGELFWRCESLTSVSFSSDVMSIGEEAFRGCEGLCDKNGFVIVNGILFDYFGHLDNRSRNVIVPEGVTGISANAFHGAEIESIVIPSTVAVIGYRAFSMCRQLRSITFRSNCFLTRRQAFISCDSLEQIEFLPSAEQVSRATVLMLWNSFVSSNKSDHFSCVLLKCCPELVVSTPELRTRIKRRKEHIAFAAAGANMVGALKSLFSICRMIRVELLDKLIDSVDGSAFEVRAFLIDYKNKHYPAKRLEKMENERNERLLGLKPKSVTDYRAMFSYRYVDGGVAIKRCKVNEQVVLIPCAIGVRTVTQIDDGAFCGLKMLQRVIVPETVTEIADNAFDNFAQLVISAPEGSAAQAYAQKNNIAFIRFDADSDNK